MTESTLCLLYPQQWIRDLNSRAFEAEEATLEWLRRRGVVESAGQERVFAEMGVARYAGRPFPDADASTLELLMKILTLWLIYDDEIEGLSESDPELVLDSVCGIRRRRGQDTPVLEAWLELGEECSRRMSAAWIMRHRRRFAAWLFSTKSEARMVHHYRRSRRPPSLAAYLDVRMTTIGVLPTLDLVELEVGAELPGSFLRSSACRDIEVAATLLVILQNDITGLNKDKRNDWTNGALSAAGVSGDEFDGVQTLVDLHGAYVSLLARRAEELRTHPAPQVVRWVEHICWMVGGWSKWHLEAQRYDQVLELSGGRRVRIQSGVAERDSLPPPESAQFLPELRGLCQAATA